MLVITPKTFCSRAYLYLHKQQECEEEGNDVVN